MKTVGAFTNIIPKLFPIVTQAMLSKRAAKATKAN